MGGGKPSVKRTWWPGGALDRRIIDPDGSGLGCSTSAGSIFWIIVRIKYVVDPQLERLCQLEGQR